MNKPRFAYLLGVILLVASAAWAGDSKNVSVNNSTKRAASDLHVTFSGSGGALLIEPESVQVEPGDCPTPSIPSNKESTNEAVIDWGKEECVADGATVRFRVSTDMGPLKFISGYWTVKDDKGKHVNIGDVKKEDIAVKSAPSGDKIPARIENVTGLFIATFDTPHGVIKVNLPDDTAAGDTVWGTVVPEPAGKKPKERARNEGELNGYVVDTERTATQVGKKILKWAVPVGLADGTGTLILRNREGTPIAGARLPVATAPPTVERRAPPQSEDFDVPTIGQAGRPMQVSGPFGADLASTVIRVGGYPAAVLAKSPRKVVVQSPIEVTGPTEIEVREGDLAIKRPFRNVALRLDADRTTLRRGEEAVLQVTVKGLQGLETELPVWVDNLSPQTVQMEEGNERVVLIQPRSVPASGTYKMSIPLRGVASGPFHIVASVPTNLMGSNFWKNSKEAMSLEQLNDFIDLLIDYYKNLIREEQAKPKPSQPRLDALNDILRRLQSIQSTNDENRNGNEVILDTALDRKDFYNTSAAVAALVRDILKGITPKKKAIGVIKFLVGMSLKEMEDAKKKADIQKKLRELEDLEKELDEETDDEKKKDLEKKIDEKLKELQELIKPSKFFGLF